MIFLSIDPDRWTDPDLETRLALCLPDIRTVAGFKAFVAERQQDDPSAALSGWRRGLDKDGQPELIAIVTWRGKSSPWRFHLLSTFWDPLDSRRYWVFDADMPRIGLDFGIAMADVIFMALPTLADLPAD